ncbi:MAG TPA: Ig-like domain-containing protein [Terriglobales bacterium]|nr:Ig-like domain-containing protein [Terriglobales bacterium]
MSVVVVLAMLLTGGAVLLSAQDETPPKIDLFLGYQWLNPGGTVPVGTSTPFQPPQPAVATKLNSMPIGYGVTGTYNFDKWWGLSVDVGGNFQDLASESSISVGPRLMWRGENLNMFVHTMLGLNRLSPKNVSSSNGIGTILGGGIDIKATKYFSIRLIEADYVLGRHNFADDAPVTDPGLRRPVLNGVRLRTGLVFNIGGGAPEVPVAASCSADHSEVMVGEPVHVTVAPSNFNPKHTLNYAWSSTGGKLEGKDTGASIDTNGLAGGSYTVTARVTDAKAKKNNEASCSSSFTVKEPPKNPPQMSCSANPTSVLTGSPSTITCTCTSPDSVPVSVGGWTATGGSVSGSGNSATLNTTGAPAGTVTVNATCTDSRGLTASASSSVTVENPPPPPPQASKLNECQYPNKMKPWRVDNTCKAMLDDAALKLQQDPEAKLVVVGNADPKEKRKNLAAERAVDVKAYISGGEAKQNIDPSRIETRTGNAGTMTSEQWIVPAGATFPEAGSTAAVDETKVKAIPDHPKPAAKKPAQKAQ